MKRTEKCNGFRSVIAKFTGLLVAPFVFSAIIVGILLLIANITIGDVFGYASLLFMKLPNENYEVEEFFVPADTEEVLADTVDITEISFPDYEKVYGEISIPSVGILCPLIYGDTDKALKTGACQYIGSTIIGYGGTTMISAHVNRHFKKLHKVKIGDQIQIRTHYGVYTYDVKYVGVHSADDTTLYDLSTPEEKVVLYTCYYERTALGNVKKRFFVCADYVSGPMIVDGGGQK